MKKWLEKLFTDLLAVFIKKEKEPDRHIVEVPISQPADEPIAETPLTEPVENPTENKEAFVEIPTEPVREAINEPVIADSKGEDEAENKEAPEKIPTEPIMEQPQSAQEVTAEQPVIEPESETEDTQVPVEIPTVEQPLESSEPEAEDTQAPAQVVTVPDEEDKAAAKETIETQAEKLKKGVKLYLNKVSLYASSVAAKKSSTVSGTFYMWGSEVVKNRIRITNRAENVGKKGQVTGWINISAVQTEANKTKKEDMQAPAQGTRAAFLAMAVSQKGYSVSTYKVNKYTKWYCGDNKKHEWCGMFVVWCARKAGVSASVIPKSAYIPYFYGWFKKKALNVKALSSKVEAGDLIIFDWAGSRDGDHIGIVEKADSSYIWTIEGNKSAYGVSTRKISRSSAKILTVAKPKFN